MQRILSTERLQLSVRDSWWNLWGPAILKQASVEKTKSKVAHVLENLADEGICCDCCIKILDPTYDKCCLHSFAELPSVSALLVLPYLLPDSRVTPDHECIIWAIPVSL